MDKKAIFEIDVRRLVVTNARTFDGKSLCEEGFVKEK